MLTLYYRPTCPYSHKVRDTAERLGIALDLKDIADPANAAALIKRGGKQQVPYLVDAERGVEMYESADIAGYLEEHYAPK